MTVCRLSGVCSVRECRHDIGARTLEQQSVAAAAQVHGHVCHPAEPQCLRLLGWLWGRKPPGVPPKCTSCAESPPACSTCQNWDTYIKWVAFILITEQNFEKIVSFLLRSLPCCFYRIFFISKNASSQQNIDKNSPFHFRIQQCQVLNYLISSECRQITTQARPISQKWVGICCEQKTLHHRPENYVSLILISHKSMKLTKK